MILWDGKKIGSNMKKNFAYNPENFFSKCIKKDGTKEGLTNIIFIITKA